MANNKFLQILRNFSSADRSAADQLLRAAAQGNLFHPGTPIVAFYNQNPASGSKGEDIELPVRANGGGYAQNGTTLNYQALLGIMGANRNEIEIFDIASSVEALLGGATQVQVQNSGTHTSGTWDFRSLGGIQVVIEEMDQVIATSLTALNNRINAITGQSGDRYSANQGNVYTGSSNSLQDAIDDLDTALAGLASTVSGNKIINTDGTISVTQTTDPQTQEPATAVGVIIKGGENVIAKDGNNGLYTDIKVIKVIPSGTAGTNEVVDSTLGTNIKEAYRFMATDGTTQLGHQIDIYKDSSLKEVYLGASTDTIDASTGVITKNSVTDPQSMNFAYQLADGTYSLTKIDVSKFLTESEFGDGLAVSGGVVSVDTGDGLGINSTSKAVEVVTGNGIEIDTNDAVAAKIGNGLEFAGTNSDEITVKIDSTNDSNNYLSVSANGVAFNGNAIADAIENAATTLTTVAAQSPAETTADGTDFIKVVSSTESDGHTNYAVSTQGIKDYVADAVDALDGEALASTAPTAVSYSGTNSDEFQVLTRVNEVNGVVQTVDATANSAGSKSVTLKRVAATGAATDVSITDAGNDYTTTTVEGALGEIADRLDAVEGTADTALQSVSGSNAININTTSPANAQNPKVELKLDGTTANTVQTGTGANNALSITNDGLFLSNVWDCGVYTVSESEPEP